MLTMSTPIASSADFLKGPDIAFVAVRRFFQLLLIRRGIRTAILDIV
jgi:hypothetical protein